MSINPPKPTGLRVKQTAREKSPKEKKKREMFQSRVLASILKRNKAIINSVTSNFKGTSSSRVFTSSPASASASTTNIVARSSFYYGFRSLPKVLFFLNFDSLFALLKWVSIFFLLDFVWINCRCLSLLEKGCD